MGIKEIFCPACGIKMPETEPCEHYKKYNWKPGENETFFIKMIQQNYEPGSFGRPKYRKQIGTSAGNTRTKNTVCKWPGCNKDLNGLSYAKMEQHVEDHKKEQLQARLF